MPRQRARCRNPDCGTFVIRDRQTQVNDHTIAGLYKGFLLTLQVVVLLGALCLGSLALPTSFKWAAAIWVAGALGLGALHVLERRLEAFATITYHYRCGLCGKVWGDSGVTTDPHDLDHDYLAA